MNTVIEALERLFPDSSKATLRSWIKQGRVVVDGRIAKRVDEEVGENQVVSLEKKATVLGMGVKLLFEDRYLIVVEKPAGLLSVETAFQKEATLHAILKRHRYPGRVFPVHRLDQETSGILVFACSQEAKEGLKKQFEAHSIERIYHALVEGIVDAGEGRWESALAEDPTYTVKSVPRGGKRAVTHYRVLKCHKKTTLLEVRLETGRKNQIRVHCQEAGHPVVGDKKYGATSNPFGRLCLHAAHLGFIHPITGKPLRFTSLLPEGFSPLQS